MDDKLETGRDNTWIWTWLGNRVRLWLHLFRLCQSRTVRCNGWESCHRSYYPEHILAYGSGKTRSFRVLVSSSFRVDCMEAEIGWRSLHRIEAGLQLRGLGVLVWGGDLETSAGTEGVSLCLYEFL